MKSSGSTLSPGLAALVLDRIVEQRRDRLVLVAAVLDHQGRDPELLVLRGTALAGRRLRAAR